MAVIGVKVSAVHPLPTTPAAVPHTSKPTMSPVDSSAHVELSSPVLAGLTEGEHQSHTYLQKCAYTVPFTPLHARLVLLSPRTHK